MVVAIIVALLLSLYRIVIGRASRYLMIIPYYNVEELSPDKVSIIIPGRNEEQNIGRCLDSILDQTLPKTQVEIIVVDDGSSDKTASIVRTYFEKNVRLLQLSDEAGGKKAALTKGIETASHPLIVTTDADCIYPNNWLNTLLSYRAEQDAVFE
jgi:glycosyltransferase involved in cell wall biosynthesis